MCWHPENTLTAGRSTLPERQNQKSSLLSCQKHTKITSLPGKWIHPERQSQKGKSASLLVAPRKDVFGRSLNPALKDRARKENCFPNDDAWKSNYCQCCTPVLNNKARIGNRLHFWQCPENTLSTGLRTLH